MFQVRSNRAFLLVLVAGLVLCSLYFSSIPQMAKDHSPWPSKPPPPPAPPPAPPPTPPPEEAKNEGPAEPRLKPPSEGTYKPVVDNFPLLNAAGGEAASLPPVPAFNAPPAEHVPENTPLLIGFTRNWRVLQQVVVSYIAAGWPPGDIHVVENTGTLDSNAQGRLTLQNPFYLNHDRLTRVFGVQVVRTPALLSFSQLQTFYMSYAQDRGWDTYFWGHMDVAALCEEDWTDPATGAYSSLYMRAVAAMRETLDPGFGKWATRFFGYDRLTLVNLASYIEVGGWDPLVSYYLSDCDFYEHIRTDNYLTTDARAGYVMDVASSLEDLGAFFRREPDPAAAPGAAGDAPPVLNSTHYYELLDKLVAMREWKTLPKPGGRNTWQSVQRGGQGEPFYRDPEGFQRGLQMTMDYGEAVYREKWGTGECNLRKAGRVFENAWKYEKDEGVKR